LFLDATLSLFTGASFLSGKIISINNNTLLDYQWDFAFPTILTGKIGVGIGNETSAATIGIRPIPTSLYFQYTCNERRLLSI
jgi:hypothetical protein